jgi:hypothetical protein
MAIFHNPDAVVIVHNYTSVHAPAYNGKSIEDESQDTEELDLSNSVLDIQIAKQKSDPVAQATVILTADKDYLNKIVLSSWICIYLKTKPITNEELNSTNIIEVDGKEQHPLKFLGIVSSVRRNQQVGSNGIVITRYIINCFSFGYLLHSQIVINNMLFADNKNNALLGIFTQINEVPKIELGSKYVINQIFSFVSELRKNSTSIDTGDSKFIESVPKFLPSIPKSIQSILGLETSKFFEVIQKAVGIDKRGNKSNIELITGDLLGSKYFYPTEIFQNSTIFSLIMDYINPVTNEIIVDLCPSSVLGKNKLEPAIIHRQIPFSSPKIKPNNKVTPSYFTDLYKTSISKDSVLNEDLGTSIHNKFNFIFPVGNECLAASVNIPNAEFNLQNPPQIDINSITRTGLKAYFPKCDFTLNSTINNPKDWAELISDWYLNSHMILNGVITTVGIDDILCLGNNIRVYQFGEKQTNYTSKESDLETSDLENTGYLAHIESLNYSFKVDESGVKTYRITFGLSRVITDKLSSFVLDESSNFSEYSKQNIKIYNKENESSKTSFNLRNLV